MPFKSWHSKSSWITKEKAWILFLWSIKKWGKLKIISCWYMMWLNKISFREYRLILILRANSICILMMKASVRIRWVGHQTFKKFKFNRMNIFLEPVESKSTNSSGSKSIPSSSKSLAGFSCKILWSLRIARPQRYQLTLLVWRIFFCLEDASKLVIGVMLEIPMPSHL